MNSGRFPKFAISCFRAHNQLTHTILQTAQPKMADAIFGFGRTHTPQRSSGLDRKNTIVGKCWGRLPHRLTWVWRNRGIVSLESNCEIASYVARGKCVEAPPAPSPWTL